MSTKTRTCPACGHSVSGTTGHADGPREYHSDCWTEVDGTLCDYHTGEIIRDATTDEAQASILAAQDDGGAGVILILDDDLIGCDHWLADDARRCYVQQ